MRNLIFVHLGLYFISLGLGELRGAETQTSPTNTTPSSSSSPNNNNSSGTPLPSTEPPAMKIPDAKELVTINFTQPTPLVDALQAVSAWRGSTFVIDASVNPGTKIQIMSPLPVTKQEAYQAFLSALSAVGLTVVETGKVSKIISIKSASSENLKTFYGSNWALQTEQVYTQIIPLKYSSVNDVTDVLRTVISGASITPFPATNSIIMTAAGNTIQRAIEVIQLLDVEENRPKVSIVPIRNSDARLIQAKITEIYGRNSVTLKNIILDERMNALILVAPPRGLEDVTRLIKRLDVPTQDSSTQNQIHVRALNFANATKLAETLRRLSGSGGGSSRFPFAGGGGKSGSDGGVNAEVLGDIKITADEPTNSLIIQGSQIAYNNLNRIIDMLDQRRAQVFIEANIIDIDQSRSHTFNTSFIGGTKIGENIVAPFGFTPEQAASLGINVTNGQAGAALLKAAQAVLSSQEAIFGVMAQKSIQIADGISLSPGAFVFALKGDVNSNVLQTPSLLVANNEKAVFEAGTDEFFNTTIINPLVGVPNNKRDKVTASLKLEIQPQLTSSRYINLDLDLTADSFGARNPQTHEIINQNKRRTQTKVTVESGRIVIISGLNKDTESVSENKVPLLGDIPILGWLFRDSRRSKSKSSLTVFITPYVIKDSEDLAKIYEKKIRERDEYFKVIYGKSFTEEEFYQKVPKIEDARRHFFGGENSQDDTPPSVSAPTTQSNPVVEDNDQPIYVPDSSGGSSMPAPVETPPPPPSSESPPQPQTGESSAVGGASPSFVNQESSKLETRGFAEQAPL